MLCVGVQLLKGHLPSKAIPTDPCEYRLYEILQVYGSSFVALVSDSTSLHLLLPPRCTVLLHNHLSEAACTDWCVACCSLCARVCLCWLMLCE